MPEDLKPNPNHQELLNLLPGELHALVVPVLKKWDQNVNNRFAEIRSEYDEYKPFKSLIDANVDPSFAQQAVALVNQLQENPEAILKQINDNWQLGYLSKDEIPNPNDEEEEFEMGEDIFKDPRIQQLVTQFETLQNKINTQEQTSAEQQAVAEFEKELDALESSVKEKQLPFDRTFVTAVMAQGVSGEDAVNQFHQLLAAQGVANLKQSDNQTQEETPPVVLGGAPVGSGLADGTVKFGTLSKNDTNGVVEQLLAARAQSEQG